MNANRHNHLTQFIEAQATIKSQTRIIAEQQRMVDRAKSQAAGLEHIVRKRDERIRELESELYLFSCTERGHGLQAEPSRERIEDELS